MKYLAIPVVGALAVLPLVADYPIPDAGWPPLVNEYNAIWTGEKRLNAGKLECVFVRLNSDFEDVKWWETSMDNGQSPVCPLDLYYNWYDWHVGDRGNVFWDNWKETEAYTTYKYIADEEKKVRDEDSKYFVVRTPDDRAAVITKENMVAYLARVRLGLSETYSEFLANNVYRYVYLEGMSAGEREVYFKQYESLSKAMTMRTWGLPTPQERN